MNLQAEGQRVQTQSEKCDSWNILNGEREISFLDSISEPLSTEVNDTQVSHQMALQMTLDEIAEQNSTSAVSKELPSKSLAQIQESQNFLDVHGNLENIAQRIFDQDIHDLEFQETEISTATSSELPSFSGSAFVEVSHFNFFTPAVEGSCAQQNNEDGALDESSTLPSSSILPENLSLSRAPGLCDDLLIKEIQTIPQRLSFKIGDVADLLGIKPFVLRYWETEFEVLKPKKAQNKQRMYSRKQVEIAFLVRKLLHRDRYSIEGARNAMKAARQSLKQRLDEVNQSPSLIASSTFMSGPLVSSVPAQPQENSSISKVQETATQECARTGVNFSGVAGEVSFSASTENSLNDLQEVSLLQNLERLRSRVQALRRVTQEFRDQMAFR